MGFPDGVQTVTITAGASGYRALDGTPYVGTIRFTPSVPRVVSAEHGVIALGPVNVTLSASGAFTEELLATDSDGFEPSGWTYRVDEEFTNAPGRAWNMALPAADPTVDLPSLTPIDASNGTTVWTPPGGGTPSNTVTGETSYGQTANAGTSTTYARGDHTHGTAPLPTTGTTAGTYAAGNDTRLSDARTPLAHAASHGSAGSDPITIAQSQVTGLALDLAAKASTVYVDATFATQATVATLNGYVDNTAGRIAAVEDGTAWLSALHVAGDAEVSGGDLTVHDTVKGYRFRRGGSALDLEATGADLLISNWSGTGFNGTQRPYLRLSADAQNIQVAGKVESVATLYGDAVHTLDPTTGVASLGAKNGIPSVRLCGRLATSGAPTTGAWTAGDAVQDAEGVWWLCTADGTPGTWTGRAEPWKFDVTKYGAVGDAKIVTDGAVTGSTTTLTCATSAPFSSSLVGKPVLIQGAGPAGVTAFVTTFAAYNSPTSMTLTAAPPTTAIGATVVFGTNNYTAVRAATAAAEAYLAAGHPYAEVYTPPIGGFVIDGPLDTSKSGNGQVPFGVYPTTEGKKSLNFRSDGSGAGVRHWQQLVPQISGGTWISFGFYSSTSAQTTDLNANGHPGIISGPNEGTSNGGAYGAAATFSNIQPMITNMAFLVPHTQYGITRGAWNFYGCANAHIRNVSISTLGVVTSNDYTSPGTFATGLSVAALMPAPGNNDLSVIENLSIQGGFTYGLFFSEHTIIDRIMVLYCWAALCPVGNYAGSVGSVHEMIVLSASVEACAHDVYIIGVGSQGVGPTVDIHLSTESSTPNVDGNSAGALMAALGTLKLTGLFTPSGVYVAAPTGIEIINGQAPRSISLKTGAFTASPIDRTLICDTTASAFTATLPNADVNPVEYTFRNVGANDLTIDPAGTQTIDGGSTLTVPHGQIVQIQALYNGSAWGWYSTVRPSVDLTSDQAVAGNKTFSWYTVLEGGQVNGEWHMLGTAGFFGATPAGRQTVTGAKGGNTALASLINALVALGLITDTTT